jgi:hypothetical protein
MVNENNIELYLKMLQDAQAKRVLLISNEIYASREAQEKEFFNIKKTGEVFRERGFETAIWVGCTIGHGVPLGTEADKNQKVGQTLVNLNGEVIGDTHCPFEDEFCLYVGDFIKRLAENTDVKLIFLDDDYRLSQHGSEFCCACDLHMKRICEILGEEISREELKQKAFFEKANKYRLAWLQVQRESLEKLANVIRKEVDTVDESVCVALCVAHSIWGADGSSATDVTKVLAGKNKPVARLHPAPYWANHCGMPLAVVCELARMFAKFSENSGVELIAEGDTWPRPRYATPASTLEMFDALIRADGRYDGDLKYMLDYWSPADYETGYIKHHVKNLPQMEMISEIFRDKNEVGVYVPVDKNVLEYADFSLSDAYANNYPFPAAARMLARLGIPTVFDDNGIVTALFGETARKHSLKNIKQGAILDAISAKILCERGVDVGIKGEQSFFTDEAISVIHGDEKFLVCINRRGFKGMRTQLNEGAQVEIWVTVGNELVPLAYNYVNADGQKFTVFLVDTMCLKNDSALFDGYMMQRFIADTVEWISGKRLPATSINNPDVYIFAKKNENKTSVLLLNASADSILEPMIELDGCYKTVRTVNLSARIENNKVIYNEPINAYSFTAFEVEK